MPTRSMTSVSREDCERLHAELLRLGAHGVHKAVPRRLLAEIFGGDRRLRHVMHEAPSYRVAVASTEDGYYAAVRPEDIDPCVSDLRSRAAAQSRRADGLEAVRRDLATDTGRLF
jgi:hypothetical protein